MWNSQKPPPQPAPRPLRGHQETSVADVVKRLVRIESKLHALAKGLQVDLNQQLEQETQEGWGNR